MRLRIITVASDYYEAPNERLKMESQANNEAIMVLPTETRYFEDLEKAMKIDKYTKRRDVSYLSENLQDIIVKYNQKAQGLKKQARENIKKK